MAGRGDLTYVEWARLESLLPVSNGVVAGGGIVDR
jgi:hypothetical protein